MDALTGRPLIKLMDALPLADDIKHALQGDPGIIRSVYDLVLAYEHGDWPFVELLATQLGMDMRELPHVYRDAVRWSGSLTRGR
jgi:c-di-GMP-related signal transduction protein